MEINNLREKCNKVFDKMREQYREMTSSDYQTVAVFINMLVEECEKKETIYTKNGYANRKEYLRSLAEEYAVPYDTVCALAMTLGPSEDFDGLVSMVQDNEGMSNEDDKTTEDDSFGEY